MTGDQSPGLAKRRPFTRIRFRRVSAAQLVAFAAFALLPAYATVAARADDGSAIFTSKCAACHTIGKGKSVGPDLKGITTTEDPNWLKSWISSPSTMVKSGDAKAARLVKQYPLQMPDLGLSSADIDSVLGYIAQQSGNTRAPGKGAAPPATAALPPGDAAAGRELFVGGIRMKNGGPPCMSCHSISGIGALGGGTLGPDLTDAYKKYGGDAGLASFLTSVPTPTMSAVWSKNPLTPQEVANLTAFVKEGALTERPLDAIAKLALMAALGLVILVLIGTVYWRRRLITVRKALVQRANMNFLNKAARRS
jgi:mono/diheme cytochrome c family protein